ncbi:glutamate receptor 2-like [Lineus longissimus]|uniref:glutamate receptor 2-like n=1 Tax=Lineus longissimus TaxID=88925 RepID=UPI002B4C97A1
MDYLFLTATVVFTVYQRVAGSNSNCGTIRIGLLPTLGNDNVYDSDQLVGTKYDYYNTSLTMQGNCYHFPVVKISLPAALSRLKKISDDKVLNQLGQVHVIIGEYRACIEFWARDHDVPFILTTPVTVSLERRLKRVREGRRVVFSAWPSMDDFYALSTKVLNESRLARGKRANSMGNMLIFRQGRDVESLSVAQSLNKALIEASAGTSYAVLSFDNHANSADMVSRRIIEEKPSMVVYIVRKPSDLTALEKIYKDLERTRDPVIASIEWFFWDMNAQFTGAFNRLQTPMGYDMANYFNLRTIGLRTFVSPFELPCHNLTEDITRLIGEYDAAALVRYNAVVLVPAKDFFSSELLMKMRERNIKLAGQSQEMPPTQINSGWSFLDGFRVSIGIDVGSLVPKIIRNLDEPENHLHSTARTEGRCFPDREYYYIEVFDMAANESIQISESSDIPNDPTHVHDFYTRPAQSGEQTSNDKVAVVLERPFAFKREVTTGTNDDFRGIVIDIVREVYYRLGQKDKTGGKKYEYTFVTVPDNGYGKYDRRTRTWNGAMGSLQANNASFAVGMISKTKIRKRDFDFSPAFEYVGVTYVRQKSQISVTIFGFMQPFDTSIWWGILGVFIISGLFIRALDYWNPFWNKVPHDHRFTIKESLWYSFGTVVQAGGNFAPKTAPLKVFSVFYWLFAWVLTACYTGNLASYLTEKYDIAPNKALGELVSESNLQWGTLKSSYMDTYVKSINDDNFIKLSKKMTYVDNYKDGVDKVVQDGNFAFIGTNLLLHYYAANDPMCEVGLYPNFQSFTELAFPMRRDWVLKREFNDVMVHMRSDGTLKDILQKYLHYSIKCEKEEEDLHIQLDWTNLSGLYMMLAGFIGLSFVALFFKLVYLKCCQRSEGIRKNVTGASETENSRPMITSFYADETPI